MISSSRNPCLYFYQRVYERDRVERGSVALRGIKIDPRKEKEFGKLEIDLDIITQAPAVTKSFLHRGNEIRLAYFAIY